MTYMMMDTKIIKQLDKQQKEAFLHAFIKIACADGHFDDSEKDFIFNAAFDLGIDYETVGTLMNYTGTKQIVEEVSKIKDRAVALELIKELCLLSHADGQLSEEETLFIGEVAQALNVELEKVEQISGWVVSYLILQEQGKIVFEQV